MSHTVTDARDAACYESYQGDHPELGAWDSVVEPGETYMVLGNSIAHLLYNRDYTVILGRAVVTYGVPHVAEQWQVAQASIQKLLGICEVLDSDGITLYTPQANAEAKPHFHCYESVTTRMLPSVLAEHQPLGEINLALSLQTALAQFFDARVKARPSPMVRLFWCCLMASRVTVWELCGRSPTPAIMSKTARNWELACSRLGRARSPQAFLVC